MANTLESLKAKIAAANAARPQMSTEDAAEADLREQLATVEKRNREEATRIRRLTFDRAFERLRAELPEDVALEIVDTEAHMPGTGCYILRSGSEEAVEQFNRAMRSNPEGATEKDTRDLVMACIVYPDPEQGENGSIIRDIFDRFQYLPRTLSNEALRLSGLVTDLRRRKS